MPDPLIGAVPALAGMFRRRPSGQDGGMSKPSALVALCSSIALSGDDGKAPDWLHLIPAGEVRTNDGRGPYRIADVTALMASSLKAGDKLVLDENHATDLAAPRGEEAPARGWIVELQQRSDGIWGKVEWTDAGRAKIEAREYRGVSPVIAHRADGTIVGLLRASLTNKPNFQGLSSLHMENDMDFRGKVVAALGLDDKADDDAIVAAIGGKSDVALQSALAPIAAIVGVDAGAGAAAVLAGVEQLKAGSKGDDSRVTALQAELVGVTSDLNSLRDERKKEKAEGFVDGAIAAGRVGVKPLRDDYIAMHMENPARAEKLVNAMPVLKSGATLATVPEVPANSEATDPVQIAAHATTYQRKQAEAGVTIDFAAAVMAVKEGKHK